MNPSETTERIFPLLTISAGDYLLIGNDARTLWRIRRYDAEFVAEDESTRYVPGWGAWRWTRRVADRHTFDSLDLDDPDQWEFWDGPFRRRAEALADVLTERR